MEDPGVSDECLVLLRELLTLSYIEGGVPASVRAAVEECLKGAGQWFHDPQYAFHPSQGYL